MKYSITKDFGTFDAAHQLPNHDGKCANLHGHTYRVVGEFSGPIDEAAGESTQGMIIDFGVIKDVYKRRIENRVDHALLLGTVPLPWVEAITRIYSGAGVGNAEAIEEAMWSSGVMTTKKVAQLPIPVTTAEYLAQWMFAELSAELSEYGITVERVTVYETPTSSASCSA